MKQELNIKEIPILDESGLSTNEVLLVKYICEDCGEKFGLDEFVFDSLVNTKVCSSCIIDENNRNAWYD